MRKFFIVPLIGVLAMLSIAAAAGLNIDNSVTAQSGNTDLVACDDAIQLWPQSNWQGTPVNDYVLQGVTVAGINSACDGMTVKVTLTAAGGTWLAEGSATISGNTPISFSPAPLTADVFDMHVSIQN